jgi:hypothetical protein
MNAAWTREKRIRLSDTAMETNQKLRVIKSEFKSTDRASPDDRQRAVVVEAPHMDEECCMHWQTEVKVSFTLPYVQA